ncbi:MAG: hypothetical protein CM15mP126_4140 [Gammaproteobacteria bacterium]|nr:MAG: hypothetical protein CM15mP126_4140 [Gammaproteobacteria bacterium]
MEVHQSINEQRILYPELDLVEKNGKRYYLDSNNHPVPSVTKNFKPN